MATSVNRRPPRPSVLGRQEAGYDHSRGECPRYFRSARVPVPIESSFREAAAAVSWRNISLVRLAAPPSARVLGCYPATPGPPLNSPRRRCPERGHPPSSSPPNPPSPSATILAPPPYPPSLKP